MNESLLKYYEYLKSKKADVPPDFESFQSTLQDEQSARKYFSYIQEKKFDSPPDFDTFASTFGFNYTPQEQVSQPVEEASWWDTITKPFQSIFADRVPSALASTDISSDAFASKVMSGEIESPEIQQVVRNRNKMMEDSWHVWSKEDQKKYEQDLEEAYKKTVGESQYLSEKEQFNKEKIKSTLEAFREMDIQDKEAAQKLEGIPQTFGEAKGVSGVAKYIAGSTSELAGQLIPSMVTLGTTSYPMERSEILMEGLNAKAKAKGITVDELIQSDDINDVVELASDYAGFNAALDMASLGTGVAAITKKTLGKELLDKIVEKPALKFLLKAQQSIPGRATTAAATEVPTEMWQEVNTIAAGKIAEAMGNGEEIDYTKSVSRFSDSDWDRVQEAGIKAATGTFVIGGAGASVRRAVSNVQKDIDKIADAGELNQEVDVVAKEVEQTVAQSITQEQRAKMTAELNPGLITEEGVISSTEEPTVKDIVEKVTPEITETSRPIESVDKEGNPKTKTQTEINAKWPGIGSMEGYQVEDAAEIARIYADKDEKGDVKRGGGLYQTAIDYLKSKGVNTLVVTFQSPDSRKALESLQKKGVIKIAENPGYVSDPANMKELNDLYEEKRNAKTETGKKLIQDKINSLSIPTRFDIVQKEGTEKAVKSNEKMTVSVRDQVRNLIKTFTEGQEKGGRKIMKMTTDQTKKVIELLKENKLSQSQVKQVTRKLGQINYFTESGVAKFNQFLDKVQQDAAFAEKLEQADKARKQLKKLAKKKDDKQKLINGLLTLNYEDDVDGFLEKASSIIDNYKPVLRGYKPVKKQAVASYIDERRRIDFQEELETKDESKIPVEGGQSTKDKQADLEWLRYNAAERIKKLPNGKLKSFNVDTADANILTKFIKLADNILENDNHFGEDEVVRHIKVREGIDELFDTLTKALPKELQVKVNTLRGELADLAERLSYNKRNKLSTVDIQKEINKKTNELIESLRVQPLSKGANFTGIYGRTLQLDSMYTSESIAAEVRRLGGLESFDGAWSRVVQGMHNVWEKGVKAFIEKNDVRDPVSSAKLNILSELSMHEEDPTSDIPAIMDNINQTLEGYRQAGDERIEEVQKFFDKIKNFTSQEQIQEYFKTNEPKVYKVWKYFRENVFTKEFTERAQKNTEEVHGKLFPPMVNYSPSVRVDFPTLGQNLEQEPISTSLKPKQSANTLAAKRVLAKDQGYNLFEFLPAIEKAYEKTLYDIEVSKSQAQMNEMMKQPEMVTLLGGQENFKLFKEHLTNTVNNQRGVGKKESGIERFIALSGKIGVDLAMILGLGRISHLVTQWTSAKVGQMAHLGDLTNYLILPEEFKNEVLSLASVASREEFDAGLNMMPLKHQTSTVNKGFLEALESFQKGTSKLASKSLTFLRAQDVNVNHTLWAAAYVKKLKDLGVKSVNLVEEGKLQDTKEREQARAYASQVSQTLQLETNPALRGELLGGSINSTINLLKRVVLPFAGFPVQTKNRMWRAADKVRLGLKYKNDEMVKEGIRWYWSAYLESISFVAMKTAINLTAIELLRQMWTGLLGDEDDEEELEKQQGEFSRVILQAAVKEALPIWTVGIAEQVPDELTNRLNYLLSESELDYDQFMRSDEQGPLKKKYFTTFGFADDYGMYGSALDAGVESYDNIIKAKEAALDDEVTYQYKGKDVKFDKDERDAIWVTAEWLAFITPFVGLGEFKSAYRKAQQQAIKHRAAESK